MRRYGRARRIDHYETVRRRKDGMPIHVSLTVSPIHDASGRLIGASSIARDISERKRIDEQFQATSQYARSLIEASLDPLVTISPEGKITDVNEATVKATGIPRDGLIGTDFSNYFTEPEKAREGYQQVFEKGFVTDYPLTIRHKDGNLLEVLYNASVYKDIRGNVLGVFAAARDVTAQRQASQYARSLIEASLDPLVTISPEGKITDVNEATVKVDWHPPGQADRDGLFGLLHGARKGPERLPAGLRAGFRHGLSPDDPPQGWEPPGRPLQCLGLQGHPRERPGGLCRCPGRDGPAPGIPVRPEPDRGEPRFPWSRSARKERSPTSTRPR